MQWNSKNIEGHKKLYNFWDFLKFTPRLHVDLFFVQSFSFLGFLKNLGFVGYVLLFLHSRYIRYSNVQTAPDVIISIGSEDWKKQKFLIPTR